MAPHTKLAEVTLLPPGDMPQVMRHYRGPLRRPQTDTMHRVLREANATGRKLAIIHYCNLVGKHWLQLSTRPYVLGDGCDGTRDREMKYLLVTSWQPTHTERFPNVPKDVARLKAIWLTAYAWQLENLPDDKAKATREQWLRIGHAIFDGKAMEDMGCTPEEIVTFDPAWPDDQVDRLLKDAYDMNYRSLVVILEDWLERSAEP